MSPLFLAPLVCGVIDQIDAGIAAVELPDQSLLFVRAARVQGGAQEGQPGCVRVRLRSRAAADPVVAPSSPNRRAQRPHRRHHVHRNRP